MENIVPKNTTNIFFPLDIFNISKPNKNDKSTTTKTLRNAVCGMLKQTHATTHICTIQMIQR